MGGGDVHGDAAAHGGDFRKNVWSMTGGPYCRPLHWKRNTAFAMFGVFLICIPIAIKSAELEFSCFFLLVSICIPIAIKSAELEQRPHHPVRPIPSQLWCKNFGKKEY